MMGTLARMSRSKTSCGRLATTDRIRTLEFLCDGTPRTRAEIGRRLGGAVRFVGNHLERLMEVELGRPPREDAGKAWCPSQDRRGASGGTARTTTPSPSGRSCR